MPVDSSGLVYCVNELSVAGFCAADVQVYLFWLLSQLLCKLPTGKTLWNTGFTLSIASTLSKHLLTLINAV